MGCREAFRGLNAVLKRAEIRLLTSLCENAGSRSESVWERQAEMTPGSAG